jgi:hypothetical protein
MLIARLLPAIIILQLSSQQEISVRFNRSTKLVLQWVDFVVTCKSHDNVSEYKASKFDTFHDYFDKIVDETMSFRLNIDVNSELQMSSEPIFKADADGFVISEPVVVGNFCDLAQPVECKDGGFDVEDYTFSANVQLSCTKLKVLPKAHLKARPGDSEDLSDDEDIEEIEFEEIQSRKHNKSSKKNSPNNQSEIEPLKPSADQNELSKSDAQDLPDDTETDDEPFARLTIRVLNEPIQRPVI